MKMKPAPNFNTKSKFASNGRKELIIGKLAHLWVINKNYHAPQWKRTVRVRVFLWPPRCFPPDQVALPQERPQVFAHRSYTVSAMPKIET